MQADKQKWNQRFSQRPMAVPAAPAFIAESCAAMMPGSVLDLASGDGAAALYLAAQGFEVTAADIAEVALTRLQDFASEKDFKVKTVAVDFDDRDAVLALGLFNNLVMTHFKPEETLWQLLSELVVPGGKLVVSTFNLRHHQERQFSRRFCLEPDELLLRELGEPRGGPWELELHQSVERNGNFMDDYRFRRKS